MFTELKKTLRPISPTLGAILYVMYKNENHKIVQLIKSNSTNMTTTKDLIGIGLREPLYASTVVSVGFGPFLPILICYI